ncbi:MAG: hypothetical protein LCH57_13115 [Proteobacteria bacterium]|nr:hypothetical protein [Pseudomonadota bacterium]
MAPRRIIRNRIQQGDIAVLALELAANRANGTISTTALKKFLEDKFKPTAEDAVPIANGHDTLFDQIVRNLVSNRNTPTSMFSKGYAIYTGNGIQITGSGRTFLNTVPR